MKRDLLSDDGWLDSESLLHVFDKVVVATNYVLTGFVCVIRWSLFLFFSDSMSSHHSWCTFPATEVSLFERWMIILMIEIGRIVLNVILVEFMFMLFNFYQPFSAISSIIDLRWTINTSILPVVNRLHTALFWSVDWWKIQIFITDRPFPLYIRNRAGFLSFFNSLLLFEFFFVKHNLFTLSNYRLFGLVRMVGYFELICTEI